jgi:ribosome biogenesis GTPase
VLFIVSGLDRDYNPRRLERYLVLASQSGVRPVLLLNKADLVDGAHLHSIVADTRQLSRGTAVVPLSALNGSGIDSIAGFLASGETGALVGSSGVGKSTLLNALLAEERQRTYPVRRDDQRGRHTTTSRQLFPMPGGWLLMDLPGLRELHLWADPEELETSFDDIQILARNCRFRDCTHTCEPGCAVQSAGLDSGRMANYRKLQREMAFLERQDDALSRMEHKRKLKQMFRAHERQQRHRSKP